MATVEHDVEREGMSVTESVHTQGAQGYSANKRIVVKPGLDSQSKVLVLLHEWGHELLHWGEDREQFTKVVKECQAEATSFVVAQYLGLEAPYSAEYLQGVAPGTQCASRQHPSSRLDGEHGLLIAA